MREVKTKTHTIVAVKNIKALNVMSYAPSREFTRKYEGHLKFKYLTVMKMFMSETQY